MITKKVKNKKFAFTLVEILVAISLVAIAASFVGIQIVKGVRQSHFRASKEIVAHKLQVAFHLAKLTQSEVRLRFEKVHNRYFVSTHITHSEKRFKNFLEKKEELKEIASIRVGDESCEEAVELEISHRKSFPEHIKITLFDTNNTTADISLSEYTTVKESHIQTDTAIYPIEDVKDTTSKETVRSD